MTTYFMIGKYSNEAIKEISADRTGKSVRLIQEVGGEVRSMYALLGGCDVVIVVDFPDNATAMKASLGLNLLTGISFNTYPAVPVDDFDAIIASR